MPRLRQVTIAIIGLGVMLLGMGITAAALGLSVAEGLRDDIRAVGAELEAMHMEARADREAMLARRGGRSGRRYNGRWSGSSGRCRNIGSGFPSRRRGKASRTARSMDRGETRKATRRRR